MPHQHQPVADDDEDVPRRFHPRLIVGTPTLFNVAESTASGQVLCEPWAMPVFTASGDVVLLNNASAYDVQGNNLASFPNAYEGSNEPIVVDQTLWIVDIYGNLDAYGVS